MPGSPCVAAPLAKTPCLVISQEEPPYLRNLSRIEEWDLPSSRGRKETTWARERVILKQETEGK